MFDIVSATRDRRSTDDFADIDQVKLAALILMRRVDADVATVWTETRVRVNAPFACVRSRQVKVTEIYPAFAIYLVQVR